MMSERRGLSLIISSKEWNQSIRQQPNPTQSNLSSSLVQCLFVSRKPSRSSSLFISILLSLQLLYCLSFCCLAVKIRKGKLFFYHAFMAIMFVLQLLQCFVKCWTNSGELPWLLLRDDLVLVFFALFSAPFSIIKAC